MIINLSEKSYRALDNTHIYSTLLKTLESKSARHLTKREENPAFEFGTMAHMFFLEPNRFKDEYIVLPELPEFKPTSDKTKKDYGPGGKGKDYTRTNEWKSQRVVYLEADGYYEDDGKLFHKNKKICTTSESESLNTMKANALKDFPILFPKYFTGGNAEFNIVMEKFSFKMRNKEGKDKEYTVKAKCRLDYVIEFEDHVVVVDVKSTKSAHPKSFKYDIMKYGYDIQEAWYTDMAQAFFNKPVYFLFFAVENSFPFNSAFYDTRSIDGKSGYIWGREKVESVMEEAIALMNGASKNGYVKQDTIMSL